MTGVIVAMVQKDKKTLLGARKKVIMQNEILIGKRSSEGSNRCYVVAEAGSNHNGNLALGKKLIEAAKECDCDAVKFQAFKTENLVTERAEKAEYQKNRSWGSTQFQMLKALELSFEDHCSLMEHAKAVNIPIFYSVFDEDSADMVEQLGVGIFKLGSGELTNIPLIKHVAKKGKPVIISTGMGSDEEIGDAVKVFKEEEGKQLILMNCSTGYPSRFEDANLRRMRYLEEKFGVPCGNSDHTEGIVVSIAAAALGAPLIEKHFTLDKRLPGPDHPMSMELEEMTKLCDNVRVAEKSPVGEGGLWEALKRVNMDITQEDIEIIMGRKDRSLPEIEKKQRLWARKSLVAATNIGKGEVLTKKNLAIKRPEKGILPKYLGVVEGRRSKCHIKEGTHLTWEMVE